MIATNTKIIKINNSFIRLQFDQGFRDGTQFWATGTPDDGTDFVYWFAEYDNQTGVFLKRCVSEKFSGGFSTGFSIDSQQNLYVMSREGPLYKLNYYDFSLEILLTETAVPAGLVVVEDQSEIWVPAFVNLVKVYDLETGDFKSQHTYSTATNNAKYFLHEKTIFNIIDSINDEFIISFINTETKQANISADLLSARPVTQISTKSFFIQKGFVYLVWKENSDNSQIYMGKWDIESFNNIWIKLLPQSFSGSSNTEIVLDGTDKIYYTWDDNDTARAACLQVDANGNNPVLLWENGNILSSSTLSVNSTWLEIEKESTGFLFILHSVGAGISMLDKLTGEKVIGTQPSPPRSNFIKIIPLTDSDQVGFRQMRLSSEDWESFIPGTEDIVRPSTGYVNNGLTFDDPFNITEFDNKKYLRLAMFILEAFRTGGSSEGLTLTLQIIKEYTDSTPDEILFSEDVTGFSILFEQTTTKEIRVDQIIDLTNTKRIYLNITESSPVDFLPTDTFIIDLYADFDF